MSQSSRFTAFGLTRRLGALAGACVAVIALSASPALAKKGNDTKHVAEVKPVSEAPSNTLAVCPGQSFAQPFAAMGDANYYTLVPGSEFSGSAEGWGLYNGAHVVKSTHPDGSSGSALDLPRGAVATSPPVCVTLQYPTARVWTQTTEGTSSVTVSVSYASTMTLAKPTPLGNLKGAPAGEGWSLSAPFEVQPQLGGTAEETRDVRFIFTAGSGHSDTQLFGLYVDPRMR